MELPHLWPPASRPDLSAALSEWFDAEPGGELLAAERRLLGHVLPDLFGYHALQLGQPAPANMRIHSEPL